MEVIFHFVGIAQFKESGSIIGADRQALFIIFDRFGEVIHLHEYISVQQVGFVIMRVQRDELLCFLKCF